METTANLAPACSKPCFVITPPLRGSRKSRAFGEGRCGGGNDSKTKTLTKLTAPPTGAAADYILTLPTFPPLPVGNDPQKGSDFRLGERGPTSRRSDFAFARHSGACRNPGNLFFTFRFSPLLSIAQGKKSREVSILIGSGFRHSPERRRRALSLVVSRLSPPPRLDNRFPGV